MRLVGNDVRGATAGDGPDVERAGSEHFVDGQLNFANVGKSVEQLFDRRLSELRIRRMGHFSARDQLITESALRSERQLIFRRLAVDDEARSARMLRRVKGAG